MAIEVAITHNKPQHNNKQKPKTMEKINLEIRDAEGGTDAKLLVHEMRDIYIKTAKINNIN